MGRFDGRTDEELCEILGRYIAEHVWSPNVSPEDEDDGSDHEWGEPPDWDHDD